MTSSAKAPLGAKPDVHYRHPKFTAGHEDYVGCCFVVQEYRKSGSEERVYSLLVTFIGPTGQLNSLLDYGRAEDGDYFRDFDSAWAAGVCDYMNGDGANYASDFDPQDGEWLSVGSVHMEPPVDVPVAEITDASSHGSGDVR